MNITLPGCTLIIGGQGAGKTYLMRYLVSKYRKQLKYGIVFSHTAFNDGNFDYIPKKYIYSEYKPEALLNLMKIQESVPKENRHLAFVFLDDCVYDSWVNCKYFKRLSTQLRHYNILLMISTQYSNAVPPYVRENTFQTAIFRLTTDNSLEATYKSFGQHFESEKEFKKYILQNTADNHFIYYDNKSSKEFPYQILKAPNKIPKFKIRY